MISKGTTHDNGGRLARYLVTGKEGEQAELWELRGFASEDIVEAFRSVHVIAAATKAEQPFFHVQVRNPDGETLTREQWHYTADRIERMLGLTDQPRAIAFHVEENTGDRHMHVAWSRIDEETLTAKALPFYKDRLKKISRELELHFGLTLVPNERADEIKYAPTRAEDEQARRLGVNPHEVRQSIRGCWERSDCGRSFDAALAEEGMRLAAGDRRDFLVIDQAGGMHALGKRILDVSAEEVRKRLADLSREQLPTVEQARALQREQGMKRVQEQPAPIWDRDRDEVAWQKAVVDAAIQKAEPVPANPLTNAIAARDTTGVLESLTQRRATFTAAELERALIKQIKDEAERAEFRAIVLQHHETVHLAEREGGPVARYSTRAVLQAERQVLTAAAGLASSTHHGVTDHRKAATLDEFASIRSDQRMAFEHATGPEALALIDGLAGTGKSYAMNAIRRAYEQGGYRVVGLGPTNVIAQSMAAEGFQRAGTVHGELFALDAQRTHWDRRTVLMVDEAAMLDTKMMALLAENARKAGAKMILVGDDRQLSSIERGGMFGVLKDRYGSAILTENTRQYKQEDRQAAAMMAAGNFADAVAIYEKKGAINWTPTQGDARAALVRRWTADSEAATDKSRFVFAYANADVDLLNSAIRDVQRKRGVLGQDREFETTHGKKAFATGDRLQFTATDKKRGIMNGAAGVVVAIEQDQITLKLDGRQEKKVTFDAGGFKGFRHGYAGTIYKGQGRTLDQTYLYHSEPWRSSASYVALTRHRDKAELFVATKTAANPKQLARQMARQDETRAASNFCKIDRGIAQDIGPPETLGSALRRALGLSEATEDEKKKRRRPANGNHRIVGPRTAHMQEHHDWALQQAKANDERRRQEALTLRPKRPDQAEDQEIDRARFRSDPDYRRSVEARAKDGIDEQRRRQLREEYREMIRGSGQR